MARLKLYSPAETRDRRLTPLLGHLVNTGPHHQGTYYVAAYTKDDAHQRLRELGMRAPLSCLRVFPAERLDGVASLLAVPGDLVAWRSLPTPDAPVALVRAPLSTAVVAGHWRADDDGSYHTHFVPVTEEN